MIVSISGECTRPTSIDFQSRLLQAISKSKFLVIDLTGIDFIDSEGLGVIIKTRKSHLGRWGTNFHYFKVVSPPGKVRNIIELTSLHQLFQLYENLNDAIAAFPRFRLLLVNPNDDNSRIAERLLENKGYEIIRRLNPEEVLESDDDEQNFDFVITEIDFGNGEDLRLINHFSSDRKTPVAVLTSRETDKVENTAFVIHKPFDPEELITQITGVLGA